MKIVGRHGQTDDRYHGRRGPNGLFSKNDMHIEYDRYTISQV